MKQPKQTKEGRYSAAASLITVLAVADGLLATQPALAQTVVAHWSFDSCTLTHDGSGNIIGVADSTGNHNATAGGLGASSAPFAGSDSVAAPFGQGLMFNGDNYMQWPNLTELMASSGAPSYSISMWLYVPSGTSVANPYYVMGDWGNGSYYVYGFGLNDGAGPPAGDTVMWGQMRNTFNSDIYEYQRNIPQFNGTWNMLTWTFNTTTGKGEAYENGSPLSAIVAESGVLNFAMEDSTDPGTFGLKGDSGSYLPAGVALSDVWVFEGVLTDSQVMSLMSYPITVPVPALSVMLEAGEQVRVSWPACATGFTLETTENLLPPVAWTPLTNGITDDGTKFSLVITNVLDGTNHFYRLHGL